ESAPARQPHVEDQAGRAVRVPATEELVSRGEGLDSQSDGAHEIFQGAAHRGIVVDDEDDGARLGHGAGTAIGSTNWNVAPRPSLAVAQSRPPWASTIERQIASPMPRPCGLVV